MNYLYVNWALFSPELRISPKLSSIRILPKKLRNLISWQHRSENTQDSDDSLTWGGHFLQSFSCQIVYYADFRSFSNLLTNSYAGTKKSSMIRAETNVVYDLRGINGLARK